jgi:acyl carrier protein
MDETLNETNITPIDRTADGTPYEEPQGEAEQAIAKVWQQVFGFERIGRNDNFFELGGHSVLGMELTEILDERLGIQLPVVTLFLNPTIREMAELTASFTHP